MNLYISPTRFNIYEHIATVVFSIPFKNFPEVGHLVAQSV